MIVSFPNSNVKGGPHDRGMWLDRGVPRGYGTRDDQRGHSEAVPADERAILCGLRNRAISEVNDGLPLPIP